MTNFKLVLKREFLKKHVLEIGVILCFILPPVGILWLMLIGWNHLRNAVDLKASFYINTTTFFFVCLAIATLGAAFSEGNDAYMLIFAMILGYLGLYLYIKERVTMAFIRRFKWIMIFGGVYIVIFGSVMSYVQVTDMFIGGLTGTIFFGGSSDSNGRLYGTTYNPNFASFLLLLILSLLLADLLKRQQQKQMVRWNYVLIVIMMFGIFQTGSRSGIGVLFLVLIIFLLRLSPRIGVVAATFPLVFHNQIPEILPRFKLFNEAFLERKAIWETSIKIWQKYPFFGTTPIGYRQAYDQFTHPEPHAHNIVLGFFTEYGTIGGLAFLFLVLTFMLKLSWLFFVDAKNKALLNLFLLSVPVLFFTGIFDHPLVSPQTALLAIVLLACFDRYTGMVQRDRSLVPAIFFSLTLFLAKMKRFVLRKKLFRSWGKL